MYPAIDFFHPNVCHVCKVTCKEVELKRCSQCRMVSYCSSKHQKQNWKRHKDLCNAAVQVVKMKLITGDIKKHRLKVRSAFMSLCELLLGRKLDAVEMNMVYFRKSCWYCDTDDNLQDCPACLSSSVCPNHLYLVDQHQSDCNNLQLCLDAHLFKSKDYLYPTIKISQFLDKNFNDMDNFLTKNVKISTSSLAKALTSDLLTRPLTVYYALSILDLPLPENLKIHIVGSNKFEASTAQHWESLRILIGAEKLNLSFIGPEMQNCRNQRHKNILVRTFCNFYHQVKEEEEEADVIVVFNCGLHEFEGADDTWGPSLIALLSRKTPLILTSYTLSEAVLDVARLRELDPGLRVRQFANPFASLSPLRDIESLGVYFVNSILSIITH